MNTFMRTIYRSMMALACVSMVGAFTSVMLSIIGRQINWNIPGLDAYAGYSIAAAFFLAMPASFQGGSHIRVTLLLQNLPQKLRALMEWWGLSLGLMLTSLLGWYSCKLVWDSYRLHDVSPAADVTPLWIPQITMALGCVGFAFAFAEAIVCLARGKSFFAEPNFDDETSHIE